MSKRINRKKLKGNVMGKRQVIDAISVTIDRIENEIGDTETINSLYDAILEIYHDVLQTNDTYNYGGNLKRGHQRAKPWWNVTLSVKWKQLVAAESAYLKCKGNHANKRLLRDAYKKEQRSFDKLYRQTKRKYEMNLYLNAPSTNLLANSLLNSRRNRAASLLRKNLP